MGMWGEGGGNYWGRDAAWSKLTAIRDDPDAVKVTRGRTLAKYDLTKAAQLAKANGLKPFHSSPERKSKPRFVDGSPEDLTYISASPYVLKALDLPSYGVSARWL